MRVGIVLYFLHDTPFQVMSYTLNFVSHTNRGVHANLLHQDCIVVAVLHELVVQQ